MKIWFWGLTTRPLPSRKGGVHTMYSSLSHFYPFILTPFTPDVQNRNLAYLSLNLWINPSHKVPFPNICKLKNVTAIFKTESRLLCNNYRPISLLLNIRKIIEKTMHQRLTPFLEEQNCFYPPQFSFHLNYSTNNALMSITERIQQQVDKDN